MAAGRHRIDRTIHTKRNNVPKIRQALGTGCCQPSDETADDQFEPISALTDLGVPEEENLLVQQEHAASRAERI